MNPHLLIPLTPRFPESPPAGIGTRGRSVVLGQRLGILRLALWVLTPATCNINSQQYRALTPCQGLWSTPHVDHPVSSARQPCHVGIIILSSTEEDTRTRGYVTTHILTHLVTDQGLNPESQIPGLVILLPNHSVYRPASSFGESRCWGGLGISRSLPAQML